MSDSLGPAEFKAFLDRIRRPQPEATKGSEMQTETKSLRDVCNDACEVIAKRIAKRCADRGEPISRAKALVEAYRSPEGRELVALSRHRLAHLTPSEFGSAMDAKRKALPAAEQVLDLVSKRAQVLLDAGAVPTIEQAKIAVRRDDRRLADLEREALALLRS